MAAAKGNAERGTQLDLYRALRRDLLVTLNDLQFFRGRPGRKPSPAARLVKSPISTYCRHYGRVARRIRQVRGLLS